MKPSAQQWTIGRPCAHRCGVRRVIARPSCPRLPLPFQAVDRARARLADRRSCSIHAPGLAYAHASARAAPAAISDPAVFIDRTAREHGLAGAITGTPSAGSGAFRVNLENGDFNLLLTWLHQLATRYAVQVEAATVNGSSSAPGKVSGTVQLRPPA